MAISRFNTYYNLKSEKDDFIRLGDVTRKVLHQTQERQMLTKDLYAQTTAKVIAEIEKGTLPWVKPWSATVPAIPTNAMTGREYSGINTLLLWLAATEKGYPSHGWMTFNQASTLKASVRKGEKSTQVVFVTQVEKEEEGKDPVKQTVLKTYHVFNTAQLDNVPPAFGAAPPVLTDDDKYNKAVHFSDHAGVAIEFGSYKAAYLPHMDVVHMPNPDNFDDLQSFFGTLYHEMTHATGHRQRLNRNFGKRFGDNNYAFEELVAELGSAFLCAKFGYPAEHRSASYVESWLKILKEDNRAIFSAAGYASKSTEYLLSEAEINAARNTQAVQEDEIAF